MERETIQRWVKAARDEGDSKTMLIAERALGHEIVPDELLNVSMAIQRRIARMTPRGAQRLVAKWESY